MPAYVVGRGCCHPPGRVTNDDLARSSSLDPQWIRRALGIAERRRVASDSGTVELGLASLREALDDAGWSAADLDLVLCATSTPDALAPSTACSMAAALGVSPACLDLNAACAGFVYGLGVGAAMLQTGHHARIALVCVDTYTREIDYAGSDLGAYFGDGAATVLLAGEPTDGALEVVDWSCGAMTDGLPHAGLTRDGKLWQDAASVKAFAVQGFLGSARALLGRHGIDPGDLAGFVAHQANGRLLEDVARQLGVPAERHWTTVERFGNRGVAGAPATLVDGLRTRDVRGLVLVTVFGAGFTTGSALLRTRD